MVSEFSFNYVIFITFNYFKYTYVVPSKKYPGYPGDIPDIFFDFFNKNLPENISVVKVCKSLKENFEGLYLLSFHKI